jgi:hypothetical protein
MSSEAEVREHLVKLLSWGDAHVDFDAAVADLAPELLGRVPAGLPYSVWQLVEHIRLAQEDILDFCVNPDYREKAWPDDYWPKRPEPPSSTAWDTTLAAIRKDRAAFQKLARDSKIELTARIPHGQGQTYFREIVLAADHTAYHVGQIVLVRRLLGAWGGN